MVGVADVVRENRGGGAKEAILEALDERLERDVVEATLQIELRTELAADDAGVY